MTDQELRDWAIANKKNRRNYGEKKIVLFESRPQTCKNGISFVGAWILMHTGVCTPWRSVFFVSDIDQEDLTSPHPKHEEWFTLFEDITGAFITVYYPCNPKKGERITVIVEGWCKRKVMPWIHGKEGLALKVKDIQKRLDDKLFKYS